MRKKKYNKEVEQIRDSLDSLINDNDIDLDSSENLSPIVNLQKHDYAKIKKNAEIKAKRVLNKMLRFYLDENIIKYEEYINANLRMKYMELSQLIYLIETGEKALTTLMTQIDNGELSPRMFEVLATLQKSQLDMIKSHTLYIMAAEEATKKLSRDLQVYSDIDKEQKKLKESNSNDSIFRGTKGMIAGIKNEIDDEIEDIKDENDFGDDIVDKNED